MTAKRMPIYMVSKVPFLRNVIFVLVIVIAYANLNAQNEPKAEFKEPWTKRIFVGGNLGLQFGSITLVDISPLAGYWFTDNLAGGIGFTYQYYKDKRYIHEYSTDIYGFRVFGRYYFFDNFFGHAEYELLNYKAYSMIEGFSRINVSNVLLGGGYRQWVTDKSFMTIVILWNVNESIYSLYQNPIIRVGINVGF